jgi:hypothetical protein
MPSSSQLSPHVATSSRPRARALPPIARGNPNEIRGVTGTGEDRFGPLRCAAGAAIHSSSSIR